MPDEKNNTGNRNTGDYNTGNWNTGNSNTGDLNTGDYNTGNWNTGNRNTGHRNTGDSNTGHRNTGHCNTGNSNTGDYNTGNWNTGNFCVNDGPVFFFDQPVPNMTQEQAVEAIPYVYLPFSVEWVESSNMSDSEKQENPTHTTTGGFLRKFNRTIQEAFPIEWAKQSLETKKQFLNLPNFDADKFLKCTGVDVRLDRDLFPQAETIKSEVVGGEIEIGGKKFRLVPV